MFIKLRRKGLIFKDTRELVIPASESEIGFEKGLETMTHEYFFGRQETAGWDRGKMENEFSLPTKSPGPCTPAQDTVGKKKEEGAKDDVSQKGVQKLEVGKCQSLKQRPV